MYGPEDQPLALLDPGTGAHPYTHDWLGGADDVAKARQLQSESWLDIVLEAGGQVLMEILSNPVTYSAAAFQKAVNQIASGQPLEPRFAPMVPNSEYCK